MARFSVVALDLFERPVRFRLPFRFGAATVAEAPQAFVRARIRFVDGRERCGWAAEMMMPKWFDKSPHRSVDQNLDDLRRSLALASNAYASDRTARPAFGHAALHYDALQAEGARQALNALVMAYGAALVDRALIDAVCRGLHIDFATAITNNVVGIDASLASDLRDFAFDSFLAGLATPARIAARHTVGLSDPLTSAEVIDRPDDDLPVSLDEVIARYGARHFKVKMAGSVDDDVERLVRVASILEPLPHYAITLDANEQCATLETLHEFLRSVDADPRLTRLAHSTLYVEQPLPRERAMIDVRSVAQRKPLIIDESDATYDAFQNACEYGYTGVSSKSCKGIYKSIVNAARCAADKTRTLFLTGEDLTAQAGLAVQQDLALVALLRIPHVERNGHHYVDGFAGQHASEGEQRAFVEAHPDLYAFAATGARLIVRDGTIALGSLNASGFASAALPDIESLAPLKAATALAT